MGEEVRVRYYTPQDYKMLSEWWNGYSFTPVNPEMLPQTGFIVDDVCAGFLYKTDSGIAWLEWVIGNPNKTREERAAAIDYLIETVKIVSQLYGAKAIFTSTNNKSLIEKYNKNGFTQTDESVTHFIWR